MNEEPRTVNSFTSSERGIALVVTLLALSLFSTLAVSLALLASAGRLVSANHDEAVDLANASESALELAARELAAIDDWNDVLNGARTSTIVDGVPGERVVGGDVRIDLPVLTNQLTCGRVGWCTDAQLHAATQDRPWGANNPRWRLFLHAPLPALPAMPRPASSAYLVVWIGDDGRETDGNSAMDDEAEGEEGRYVVRARVESFGPRGGRHTIEAELARQCTTEDDETCLPGVRVLSWRGVATR